MHSAPRALALCLSIAGVFRLATAECRSYGVDFQHNGTYFQNKLSSEAFTFVSQFEGCQDDSAINIFMDPNGDQVICTDTRLRPDNTPYLSTCPKLKSELWSGEWTIAILSNNGESGDPIAYMREFSLSVGPQSTSTITPIVTQTSTVTPIITRTITTTDITTSTLPPKTVTVPSLVITPTRTIISPPKLTTVTKNLFTITRTSVHLSITKTTKTITAQCTVPPRQATPDPRMNFLQTVTHGVGPTPTPNSAKFLLRRVSGSDVPTDLMFDTAQYVQERAARLLEQRAPDPQPLIVTETDASRFVTSTIFSSAPALTATSLTSAVVTATVTPSPVTVESGKSTAAVVLVTKPVFVFTKTKLTYTSTTVTRTTVGTVTITTQVTPSASATACRQRGGTLGGA